MMGGELRELLRKAWDDGIATAKSYGDNVHHLHGEQADRKFHRFLGTVDLSAASELREKADLDAMVKQSVLLWRERELIVDAVRYVVDQFQRDEDAGYRSRDRRFAIDVLKQGLSSLGLSNTLPRCGATHDALHFNGLCEKPVGHDAAHRGTDPFTGEIWQWPQVIRASNEALPTCRECGKSCPAGSDVHDTCAGMRRQSDSGRTLD